MLGYHLLLQLHQLSVRAEMRSMIRAGFVDEARDFVFSTDHKQLPASLSWEDEDEFCLEGKMYDVVEKKTLGDSVIVRAIADEQETMVLDKLSAACQGNEKDNRLRSGLVHLLSNLYIESRETAITLIKPSSYHMIFSHPGLPRPARLILTPPPQILC